jgi:hypothetical protein
LGNPAAARRKDHPTGLTELLREGEFQLPKVVFALEPEDLTHVKPRAPLDFFIEVEKASPKVLCGRPADRRLSNAGQPNENQVRRNFRPSVRFCH